METLIGLTIFIVVIVGLVKFAKPIKQVVNGMELQATEWSSKVKAESIKKIDEIDIQESTIESAKKKLQLLNTVKS